MPDARLVQQALAPLADSARAEAMSAYMRGQFPFLGVPAAARRAATRHITHTRPADPEFARSLFDAPARELHYCACDHLRFARPGELSARQLREFVETKPWWDTVDALAPAVGAIANTSAGAEEMRQWARAESIWVRRVAIIHQLKFRAATDTDLLADVIRANLGTGEFFLDKAIGWALRTYSRTDPEWVAAFLDAEPGLSRLSVREASVYLLRA